MKKTEDKTENKIELAGTIVQACWFKLAALAEMLDGLDATGISDPTAFTAGLAEICQDMAQQLADASNDLTRVS